MSDDNNKGRTTKYQKSAPFFCDPVKVIEDDDTATTGRKGAQSKETSVRGGSAVTTIRRANEG
jgi:hypothetical protein